MTSDLSIPSTTFSTLVEALRWRAAHQPDRCAYIALEDSKGQDQSLTYAELDRRARAISVQLLRHAQAGDRALLLYPSGLDFIAAYLGCLYSGIIAVPTNPPYARRVERTMGRLLGIALDAQPTLALTTTPLYEAIATAFVQEADFQAVHWVATDAVDLALADEWQDPNVTGDTFAMLQYTSGSTSAPKGVMVSHENLVTNHEMLSQVTAHDEGLHYITWLPLFHDMGLIGNVLQSLYQGAIGVVMSPVAFLQQPVRWLEAVSRYRPCVSGGPNFAYELCIQKITPEQRANLDLSGWLVAFNGAEPIRAETVDRFNEVFASIGFRPTAMFPCYGLAEATLFAAGEKTQTIPVIHTLSSSALALERVRPAGPDDSDAQRMVGCGHGWLGEQIRIVNPHTCRPCEPDQVGEIWLTGRNIAHGYWNKAAETAQTFHAYLADSGEGPFLRTGDLGCIYEGDLLIVGRLKDLIIINGRNYYPQDIEYTVRQSHPALRQGTAAAFAVTSDGSEQLVVVAELDRSTAGKLLHLRDNPSSERGPAIRAEYDALIRGVRRAISEEHEVRVHAIVLVKPGAVPKTSSGKVQRGMCRKAYLAGTLESCDIPQSLA